MPSARASEGALENAASVSSGFSCKNLAKCETEKSADVIKMLNWKLNIKQENRTKEPQTKDELVRQLHQECGERLVWILLQKSGKMFLTDVIKHSNSAAIALIVFGQE